MKTVIFVLFCSLFLFSLSVRCEEDVVVLTTDNFDDVISKNAFVLVEFYAPWCGHCKHLAPEYAKAATDVKDEGIVLGKVDATVESGLAAKYNVRGYPTLFFFRNGEPMDYKGPRQADGIAQWVRKKSGPIVSTLDDSSSVEGFIENNRVSIIGYFQDSNTDSIEWFEKEAGRGEFDAFVFGRVSSPEGAKAAGLDHEGIIIHRNFDNPEKFDGILGAEEGLAAWINEHGHPYVESATESWGRLRQQGLPIALAILNFEGDSAGANEMLATISKIAKEYKGKFNFAHLGTKYLANVKEMGVSGNKLPTGVVVDSKGRNYPFNDEQEFDEQEIRKWLDGIAAGEIAPHFKSENIPEDNDGPVKILVGKNFEEIVFDSERDVLVEFYAPWCGHCKNLAPTFEELGRYFEENDKIIIAKMDSTANDNTAIQIQGFPTIYYFPAGNKENPIEYQGGRDLAAFVSFIKQNATPGFIPNVLQNDDDDDDESQDHHHEEL